MTKIDELIDLYVQQEIKWTIVNMRHAKASVRYRMAKKMDEVGYPECTKEELFDLQLAAENLHAESQRLMRINCDWGFYAAALLGVKLMEEGKDELATDPAIAEQLVLMKDKLIEAVSDPKNMKRLRDWNEDDHAVIIDLGNIFRPQLRVLEEDAKEQARALIEMANTNVVAVAA
jgi:hypothetical protein